MTRVVLQPPLPESKWPKRARPEAFHGPAGEYVLTLEPETEADPHAVLAILLTGFSNIIGHRPFFAVGRTTHYLNLYAMTVGPTALGRKGTARSDAMWVLSALDSTWPRPVNGLSSGEGLIEAVRDPVMAISTRKAAKGKRRRVDTVDPGVVDKRLLVFEAEFGSVLSRMRRENNSLSSVMRAAWDGEAVLRTMTRQSRLTATNAHVSIVGQITNEELSKLLSEMEFLNGFANRFLWVATRGSATLHPDGGNPDWARLKRHRSGIAAAVTFAKEVQQVRRTRRAEQYRRLRSARPGMFGAATSRADPQVVRLSCLYALLDQSKLVKPVHIEAAMALWDYCEASARFLFKASTGNPSADKLLAVLRKRGKKGMTRTQIRTDVFTGHIFAAHLAEVIVELRDAGLVDVTRETTAGRPREVVVAR